MSAPGWLDRGRYPFESRWLELDAGRMHYVDEGAGAPIVMVHGNPTWSFLYRHVIARFAPERRCVAMDHLGFGLSDKPHGWSYRPADHARNLARLLNTLDLRDITLVVHDWGGPIGLSYALENPGRIRNLVLLNTWMWPVRDDRYYVAFSRVMGGPLGRLLIRRFNLFARVVLKRAFGDPSRLTPEIHAHYLRPLGSPAEREGSAVFPREILGSGEWLDGLWARNRVLRGFPTAIVWGMADVAFREKELERWIAALPDADVTRLAGVGHFVPEEAPDALVGVVERLLAAAGGAGQS